MCTTVADQPSASAATVRSASLAVEGQRALRRALQPALDDEGDEERLAAAGGDLVRAPGAHLERVLERMSAGSRG